MEQGEHSGYIFLRRVLWLRVGNQPCYSTTTMPSHDSLDDPALGAELDTKDYSMEADELEFFRKLTGLQDEDDLKSHVVNVQVKAYQVRVQKSCWKPKLY